MPFMTAGEKRLEYQSIAGTSAGSPTLVFLHEGLGSVSMWKDFPDRISGATGHPAFVYSRAGYGNSDPADAPRPVEFMHHEALVALPQILQERGMDGSILIGHSDGASIALIFAGAFPEAPVSGLILLAPHVFVEELTIQSIAAAQEDYFHGELKARLQRHHQRDIDHTFLEWTRIWLHPEFRNWNIENYLQNIRVPMLVIQGADDLYGTHRQVDAICSKAGSAVETLILPDCGHSPHRDQPDRVLDAIHRFLVSRERF